jgi:hypothetical protein
MCAERDCRRVKGRIHKAILAIRVLQDLIHEHEKLVMLYKLPQSRVTDEEAVEITVYLRLD